MTITVDNRKFRLYLLIQLILICILQAGGIIPAFSQTEKNPEFIIDRIEFSGNNRTKDYIIRREMFLKEGDSATDEAILRDIHRIRNTHLFEHVRIERSNTDSLNVLNVIVTERIHLFPFPVFDFKENDFSKLSWGAGFSHFNLRGRNERLMVVGTAGYDPSFLLQYVNPWFADEKQLFGSINIKYSENESKTLSISKYTDIRKNIYGEFGKRFGLYTYISLQTSYQTIDVPGPPQGRVLSSTGTDKILMNRFVFKYDYRDFRRYPADGSNIEFWLTNYAIVNTRFNYRRLGFTLMKFSNIFGPVILAAKVQGDFSGGTVPLYGKVYYGYSNRIRGYYKDVLEGDHLAGGNLELRIPLMNLRHYTWHNAPFAKKLFRDLEFGAGINIFADTGQTWAHTESPSIKNSYSGGGIGIHFLLPYDSTIRVDFAINDKSDTEIIIDGGLAF